MEKTFYLPVIIDVVAAEALEGKAEARVADIAWAVLERVRDLDPDVRVFAFVEAVIGAVGAHLERRTMNGRDLANVSTSDDARVARWSPEAERLALERRTARTPGRPLDS